MQTSSLITKSSQVTIIFFRSFDMFFASSSFDAYSGTSFFKPPVEDEVHAMHPVRLVLVHVDEHRIHGLAEQLTDEVRMGGERLPAFLRDAEGARRLYLYHGITFTFTNECPQR